MAVYARCTKCDCRRDQSSIGGKQCIDKPGHKNYVVWTANDTFGRGGGRLVLSFPTEKLAKIQSLKWKSEYQEKGLIRKENTNTFKDAIERYSRDHVFVHNHLPNKSTIYVLRTLDKALGKYRVAELTEENIADARAELVEDRDWTGATANRQFRIAHAILEMCRKWKWIDKNPMEFLDSLPEEDTAPRFLTEAEILRLWREIKDPALDTYAFTLLRMGARPSSIRDCSFDNGDVDLQNRVMWFTTYKGHKSKKHRYPVPIDSALYPRLVKRYEETGGKGPVFITTNMAKLARKAIEASGINAGKAANRKFTIYGLKHCLASHMLSKGAPYEKVAALLGHTDTKMIQKHYAHLTLDDLRETQAAWNLTPQMGQEVLKLRVI